MAETLLVTRKRNPPGMGRNAEPTFLAEYRGDHIAIGESVSDAKDKALEALYGGYLASRTQPEIAVCQNGTMLVGVAVDNKSAVVYNYNHKTGKPDGGCMCTRMTLDCNTPCTLRQLVAYYRLMRDGMDYREARNAALEGF